jgi:hypothetical protein
MYMHKKITKAIAGTLLVTSFATLGCDPGPADSPPSGDSSVEIDATPQAHTSSDTVTKWKFQNRKRDGIITGKSADGKERFRLRFEMMPDFRTSVFIVTKPSVLVMSVQQLANGSYQMAPTPDEVSTPFDQKTMAYLKQLQGDIMHHKHGFDATSCFTASVAAGLAATKFLLSSALCEAAILKGMDAGCAQMDVDAAVAGAAVAVMATACGWIQDVMDSVQEMGAAIDECSGFYSTYGIATDCTGIM